MGCFSETCAISGLPVDSGDETVVIAMTINGGTAALASSPPSPVSSWMPASLPFFGEYDDYGFVDFSAEKSPAIALLATRLKTTGSEVVKLLSDREPLPGLEKHLDLAFVRRDVWDAILEMPFPVFPASEPTSARRGAARAELKAWISESVDAAMLRPSEQRPQFACDTLDAMAANSADAPGILSRAIRSPGLAEFDFETRADLIGIFIAAMQTGEKHVVDSLLESSVLVVETSLVTDTLGALGKPLLPGKEGPQSGACAAHWIFESAMADLAKGDLLFEMEGGFKPRSGGPDKDAILQMIKDSEADSWIVPGSGPNDDQSAKNRQRP